MELDFLVCLRECQGLCPCRMGRGGLWCGQAVRVVGMAGPSVLSTGRPVLIPEASQGERHWGQLGLVQACGLPIAWESPGSGGYAVLRVGSLLLGGVPQEVCGPAGPHPALPPGPKLALPWWPGHPRCRADLGFGFPVVLVSRATASGLSKQKYPACPAESAEDHFWFCFTADLCHLWLETRALLGSLGPVVCGHS